MLKIYVYVLDTMADWELGYVTAELHSRRFFKKSAPQMEFKTVGLTKDPIKTMGGMTIIPDCIIDEPAVTDHNLITAACTGSLFWAKQIIEHLGVFQADTLEAWYNYFNTGKAEYFYAMMQSVQSGSEN